MDITNLMKNKETPVSAPGKTGAAGAADACISHDDAGCLTVCVGYVGVINVVVYDDSVNDAIGVTGYDHAGEVEGFERDYRGTFIGAWRWAAKYINRRGGTILCCPPAKPRPPKKLTNWKRFVKDETVFTAPPGCEKVFESGRKARKWAKKHRREIMAAWDW